MELEGFKARTREEVEAHRKELINMSLKNHIAIDPKLTFHSSEFAAASNAGMQAMIDAAKTLAMTSRRNCSAYGFGKNQV